MVVASRFEGGRQQVEQMRQQFKEDRSDLQAEGRLAGGRPLAAGGRLGTRRGFATGEVVQITRA